MEQTRKSNDMSATRKNYCSNCDRETKQFKQGNLDFGFESEQFIWHCRRCNKTVSELSKKEITDIFRRKNLDRLIGHIAQYFTIEISQIRSNTKKPTTVLAKHLFSFIALRLKYGSTREIGAYLNRPHTAIQRGKTFIDENLHSSSVQMHVNAIANIIEHTDKVLLFKTILQKTPIEKLPKLIDHVNSFQRLQ